MGEGRVDDQLARAADAEPAADVREGVADGEGGRHQHGRLHGVEQQLLELRCDVDRRRAQLGLSEPVALRPDDRRDVVAALEHRLQRERQAVGVAGQRVGLLAPAAQAGRDAARARPRMPSARRRAAAPGRATAGGRARLVARRTGARRAAAGRRGRRPADRAGRRRRRGRRRGRSGPATRCDSRTPSASAAASSSSCASSKTTRSCGGRIAAPPPEPARSARSAMYSAWLTSTTSTSPARARAASLKQRAALAARRSAAAVGPDCELVPYVRRRHVVELVAVARAGRQHPLAEPREIVVQPEVEAPARRRRLRAAQVVGATLDDRRGQRAARRQRAPAAGRRSGAGPAAPASRSTPRCADRRTPRARGRPGSCRRPVPASATRCPRRRTPARRRPRAPSARGGRGRRGAPTRAPTPLRDSARR